MLQTQPNLHPGVSAFEQHELPLPQCCPISGNPQPGSKVIISYRPRKLFLEVYSLRKYIDLFIGGHEQVRDMEGMIQQIARDCANTLGAFVRVDAHLVLQRGDLMRLVAKAHPSTLSPTTVEKVGEAVCPRKSE
jgi:NADPH-dependent 7-cyano-7-deazaguanine reductase QueF